MRAATHHPSSPCSEAVCLDPQARMLLEHTQELLAAPAATAAAGAVGTSVGVYVGCMYTGARAARVTPAGTRGMLGSWQAGGRMHTPTASPA